MRVNCNMGKYVSEGIKYLERFFEKVFKRKMKYCHRRCRSGNLSGATTKTTRLVNNSYAFYSVYT